jgi:hypothetical protein
MKRMFLVLTGMVILALAFGMMVIGCNNSTTPTPTPTPAPTPTPTPTPNPDPDGGAEIEDLPPANGANALGGKTYYGGTSKSFFPLRERTPCMII